MLAFRRRLLKQHEEHVLLGVDHHIAAAGAVPDKKASLNFRIVRRVMTSNSLFTGSPLHNAGLLLIPTINLMRSRLMRWRHFASACFSKQVLTMASVSAHRSHGKQEVV